jgi:hypothetical protein
VRAKVTKARARARTRFTGKRLFSFSFSVSFLPSIIHALMYSRAHDPHINSLPLAALLRVRRSPDGLVWSLFRRLPPSVRRSSSAYFSSYSAIPARTFHQFYLLIDSYYWPSTVSLRPVLFSFLLPLLRKEEEEEKRDANSESQVSARVVAQQSRGDARSDCVPSSRRREVRRSFPPSATTVLLGVRHTRRGRLLRGGISTGASRTIIAAATATVVSTFPQFSLRELPGRDATIVAAAAGPAPAARERDTLGGST